MVNVIMLKTNEVEVMQNLEFALFSYIDGTELKLQLDDKNIVDLYLECYTESKELLYIDSQLNDLMIHENRVVN